MTAVSTTQELSRKLECMNFQAEQLQILADIADALVRPVGGQPESSDPVLGSVSFWRYFANVLLVHHATNDEKFKKKAFEFAFRNACRAEGFTAAISASQTNPGADVIVSNTKYSLKTEADKSISAKYIKISKLMEARWIREVAATERRGDVAKERILGHLEQYDRILTLRAFDVLQHKIRTHVRYELWEIPIDKLRLIENLTAEDFTLATKNNTFGAEVSIDKTALSPRVFLLRMDGSVEKITVASLDVNYCRLHAVWGIPVDPPIPEDDD